MTLLSGKLVLPGLNTISGTSLEVRIGTVTLQTDINILPCLTWNWRTHTTSLRNAQTSSTSVLALRPAAAFRCNDSRSGASGLTSVLNPSPMLTTKAPDAFLFTELGRVITELGCIS